MIEFNQKCWEVVGVSPSDVRSIARRLANVMRDAGNAGLFVMCDDGELQIRIIDPRDERAVVLASVTVDVVQVGPMDCHTLDDGRVVATGVSPHGCTPGFVP